MSAPVTTRPHIADADYYRLGYQLAAQLMNRAADSEATRDSRSRGGAPAIVDDDPLAVARRLRDDARTVLAWYEQRGRSALRWRRPSAQEERLQMFLAQTVEPCCALLAARCLHRRGRADEAQPLVDHVLELARAGTLSYRAYYALACLEANTGDPEQAIAFLSRALHDAPRRRRGELAEWASSDPAFERVRDEVLALVAPRGPAPPAPPGAAAETGAPADPAPTAPRAEPVWPGPTRRGAPASADVAPPADEPPPPAAERPPAEDDPAAVVARAQRALASARAWRIDEAVAELRAIVGEHRPGGPRALVVWPIQAALHQLGGDLLRAAQADAQLLHNFDATSYTSTANTLAKRVVEASRELYDDPDDAAELGWRTLELRSKLLDELLQSPPAPPGA
jgi:tetratricopeptide (TPR) repeat protein